MDTELGLRASAKKLRTRQLITQTAARLFVERGFDAVSVAAVARAAEVSEATVFNYFPTKEDLVFQGMEAFETELLNAGAGPARRGIRWSPRSPGSCCGPAVSWPRRTSTRPASVSGSPG